MGIIQSSEYILIKLSVMEKVKQLLTEFVPVIDDLIISRLPVEIQGVLMHAKISKGENYQQLPYMILDHPRFFNGENILALRTMFWWSKFVSITLHLSGTWLAQFRSKLADSYNEACKYMVCINTEQWHHHFGNDNYTAVASMNEDKWKSIIQGADFVKIAIYFPLEKWESFPELLEQVYAEISEMLN